jgi:Uma2 family endonuclease
MDLPELKYITQEEYLASERISLQKHEYFQGEILAVSGASKAHNEIAVNCIFELKTKLKGKNCRPYGSDFRVNIPKTTLFTYPDISIFCDDPNLIDEELDTATNPTILFEILSKSTRNYDQGQKFALYRAIASLKEYILIDSEAVQVIQHTKNEDNTWLLTEFNSIDQNFNIKSIEVNLNLVDLYENVKF